MKSRGWSSWCYCLTIIRQFCTSSPYFKHWNILVLKHPVWLSAKTARSGFASSRVCVLTSVGRRCEVEGTERALTDLHADFCSFARIANSPEFIFFFCPHCAEARYCLHPCLTRVSLLCGPPPPPHTPGPLPSSIPGETALSMKQTLHLPLRFGCSDDTGEKLLTCTFCARLWQRRNDTDRDSVWVSEGLHVYGICRVGRIKEGKERNKCHVSLFSWGNQVFNPQGWLIWGREKWGGNVNRWQCVCVLTHSSSSFFHAVTVVVQR